MLPAFIETAFGVYFENKYMYSYSPKKNPKINLYKRFYLYDHIYFYYIF